MVFSMAGFVCSLLVQTDSIKMARAGQILFLGVPISFIIIILFLEKTASKLDSHGLDRGCQSDYMAKSSIFPTSYIAPSSDWKPEPYCAESCKKIGIKGTNLDWNGNVTFPSGVFGVYSMSGNANFRTKYTKAGGWTIKYGCVEDAEKWSSSKADGDDGDRDAWYVTKNGDGSGAVIYSEYEVKCPSDSERFRYARMSPGIKWQMTGGEVPDDGDEDYLIFVCNPENEEDFSPPATGTGGAMGAEMQESTLVIAVAVALVCVELLY